MWQPRAPHTTEWSHTVFVLLWPAYFTRHNVGRVHPCHSTCQKLLPSKAIVCTDHICLSIHPSVDTCVASIPWLLWKMLLRTCAVLLSGLHTLHWIIRFLHYPWEISIITTFLFLRWVSRGSEYGGSSMVQEWSGMQVLQVNGPWISAPLIKHSKPHISFICFWKRNTG